MCPSAVRYSLYTTVFATCFFFAVAQAIAQSKTTAESPVPASSPEAWRLGIDPVVLIQVVGFWEAVGLAIPLG